jgi:peptidoglycan/LPS O-acetylase OafA/YrhL
MVPGLADRPAPVRLAAGVAVLALALAVAWTAYRTIERPAQRCGRRSGAERATARTGWARTSGRASRLDA